jgi:hypothetical protein
MFNRTDSPALIARMEYEDQLRERKRLEAQLDQVRKEMSMRADTV